jgi:hypothetical protein
MHRSDHVQEYLTSTVIVPLIGSLPICGSCDPQGASAQKKSNLTFSYEGPGVLEILETQKCYKKSTKKNFFKKYYYNVITKNKIFFEKKNFFSINFLYHFCVAKICNTTLNKNVILDLFHAKVAQKSQKPHIKNDPVNGTLIVSNHWVYKLILQNIGDIHQQQY